MILSLGAALISPALKLFATLIPVGYLIIESRLRHRAWADIGFSIRGILAGLRQNLGWILLVGVGIQALVALGAYYFIPEYFRHILARLPVDVSVLSVGLLVTIGVATLGEEILYRGLFQARIREFISPGATIVLTSLVFALMHYAPGAALIVVIDLASVFIDSLVFGIIFQRSQNVFVAWIAHYLGDVVGIVFLLMMK